MTKMFLFLLTTLLAVTPIQAWLPGVDKHIHALDGSNLFIRTPSATVDNAKRTLPTKVLVRGVNLGSMFVYEPFYANVSWYNLIGCGGYKAESDCTVHLGQAQANKVFQAHWNTWINQTDIQLMASYGLNTIRVPVGYWIFEDLVESGEHFPQGGLAYLEKICGWAADAGIYVIIDLHGAPGAQVSDNADTGQYIASPGFYVASQYTRAEKFLTYMTNWTHNGNTAHGSIGMLETVNEPVRSAANGTSMRKTYYPAAYNAIKNAESRLKVTSANALNIQYMNKNWGSGDPNQYLTSQVSVAYDDHRYLKYANISPITQDNYINNSCTYNIASDGDKPVIVGEFSMSPADSVQNEPEWSQTTQKAFYSQWFAAMAITFEKDALGWIYWTWKTEFATGFRWSYSAAVAAGVIPKDAADVDRSACDDYT